MAFKNLTNWARDALEPDEIREMIEELQALLTSRNAADDEPAMTRAEDRRRRMGSDSRRGGHISTAKAEAEFLAMFPDARRLKY